MKYTYKLKQVERTAYPPPKQHSSENRIAPDDTIQCKDGNWYHVVSVSFEGNDVVLYLGPDGTSAKEAILLAQQMNEDS